MSAQLYTVEQAAERLNTAPRFVRRLIAERRIAFTRIGRHVRISADVLDAFVAAGQVDPRPPIPKPRRNGPQRRRGPNAGDRRTDVPRGGSDDGKH